MLAKIAFLALLGLLAAVVYSGCTIERKGDTTPMSAVGAPPAESQWLAKRKTMVETQLRSRDITDPRVLEAMERVPRHEFVPDSSKAYSYDDGPLPIGLGQTISQPYIVAYMTQAMGLDAEDRVLEIGTGSGYQAAVLGEIVKEVYTIEIVPELARRSSELLAELGYTNIHVKEGDGYAGWPDNAPFDAIIVTAAPDHIPQPLIDQLKPGGKLVIPVGSWDQEMVIVTKTESGVMEKHTIGVRFVPMTGEAQTRE